MLAEMDAVIWLNLESCTKSKFSCTHTIAQLNQAFAVLSKLDAKVLRHFTQLLGHATHNDNVIGCMARYLYSQFAKVTFLFLISNQ